MKNNVKLFAIAALLFMASCGQSESKDENKKDSTENNTTNNGEKATPPTNEGPESKTTVDAKVNADGSTVSISKDGASVETKSGSKETQINVSKEGTNITIKK